MTKISTVSQLQPRAPVSQAGQAGKAAAKPVKDNDGDFDNGAPEKSERATAASGTTATLGNHLNVVA